MSFTETKDNTSIIYSSDWNDFVDFTELISGVAYWASSNYISHSSNRTVHYTSGSIKTWFDNVYAPTGAGGTSWSGASSFWGHSSNADIHYPSSNLTTWLDAVYAQSGAVGNGTTYWSSQTGGIQYPGEVVIGPSGTDYGNYRFQVSGSAFFSGGAVFIGELSGLAVPTYNSGAANKKYVDDNITSYELNVYPQDLQVSKDGSNKLYFSGQNGTYIYSGQHQIIISSAAVIYKNESDLTTVLDDNYYPSSIGAALSSNFQSHEADSTIHLTQSAASGQFLKYNGTNWIGVSGSFIPRYTTRPTASLHIGELIRVSGAAGQATYAYLSVKNSADSWVWMQLGVTD